MPPPDLDRWIDRPIVRTRHQRDAAVGERALWAAAGSVRVQECRVLGRLIPARIAGVAPEASFDELFGSAPFVVLDEGPGFRLSALCGRIWRVRSRFATIDGPEAFRAWSEPGTVRVLFANWVQPADRGAALVSEVRIDAVDRRAGVYLRAFGPFISAFQGLVASEPLTLAVQRAVTAGGSGPRR